MIKDSFILILLLYILLGCSTSSTPNMDAKFNSYLYQQFQVDNYELLERDLTQEEKDKLVMEKAILIQVISEYNSACLSILRENPDSEECKIIEYNTSASWSK